MRPNLWLAVYIAYMVYMFILILQTKWFWLFDRLQIPSEINFFVLLAKWQFHWVFCNSRIAWCYSGPDDWHDDCLTWLLPTVLTCTHHQVCVRAIPLLCKVSGRSDTWGTTAEAAVWPHPVQCCHLDPHPCQGEWYLNLIRDSLCMSSG